jgi:protein-S-isoprenylcysteine O-methyltransferase Ste14
MAKDGPLLALAATVCTYWGTVALLVLHRRLREGRRAGLVPRQAFERRLWLLLVPAVAAWVAFPLLACKGRTPWLGLPPWAHDPHWVRAVRGGAAAFAVICYLLSLVCWLRLGRSWSLAVVPGQQSRLVVEGVYRWVRHPIYGLSVLLMLASLVVLPVAPMAVAAAAHLLAMGLKARHEERHLGERFGASYARYCRQAGRFWPRWSALARR